MEAELKAKVVGLELAVDIYRRAAHMAAQSSSVAGMANHHLLCCLRDAAVESLVDHEKVLSDYRKPALPVDTE